MPMFFPLFPRPKAILQSSAFVQGDAGRSTQLGGEVEEFEGWILIAVFGGC